MTSAPQSPSTEAPIVGASIGTAFSRFWTKYATFSGRASRSEYWWMALIEIVAWGVLALLAHVGGAGVQDASGAMTGLNGLGVVVGAVIFILGLAVIVPNIAVGVRRLHDANLSGLFILLVLVPGVGGLIVFILTLLPSNPQGQRFDRAR